MLIHELKTHPEFFFHILTGNKTFEIRLDDRNFQCGDLLNLQEWDPMTQTYTGRKIHVEITYKLKGTAYGLQPDYCVLGFTRVEVP